MAERKTQQPPQGGVFNQFSNWLNPAPTQIFPQTGPYEMGAQQTDAFGRGYPTPKRTATTPGITPPQGPTQHRGHTALQHSAAQNPTGQVYGPPAPPTSQYDQRFDNPHIRAKIAEQAGNFEVPSLLDDESRAYMENQNQVPGAELEHMGSMGSLEQVQAGADADAAANAAAQAGTTAQPGTTPPAQQSGMLQYASDAGINTADALGKGVRGGLGYGRSLLNAALYGKGSDQDFLQQGGQALGKVGKGFQRLLFGTKPKEAGFVGAGGAGGGLTPEQQAMRDQGIADNPWLVNEDSENWWDDQEYEPTTNLEKWDANPRRTGYWGVN